MGLIDRFSTIFKSKANTLADKLENPNETLDYSFEKQNELIVNLRRQIVQVVATKKQLEMQKAKLTASITTLDQQVKVHLIPIEKTWQDWLWKERTASCHKDRIWINK